MLAGALALAGCGGGGGAPQQMKTPEQVCEDGGGTWSEDTTPMCTPEPTAAARANALATATGALETLAGGASAEGSALKMAMDYHEAAGDTAKAMGVSETIRASAQGVLDARKALQDAVTEAKAKKDDAMKALAGATGADKELLEREIADADAAIKAGEARLKARGLKSLQGFAAMYEGKGKTPAEKAQAEAEKLDGLASADNGPRDIMVDETTKKVGSGLKAAKNVFARGNTRPASAMKFADIFDGETKKIAVGGETHDAVSLKGVESGGNDKDFTTLLTATNDKTATHPGMYLGIPGTAYCRADACKGDGEGWYFAPVNLDGDHKDNYFVPDGAKYAQAKFVEWGMWLGGTNTAPIVMRQVGAGEGSADLGITPDTHYMLGAGDIKEATYTGAAAGLSTRKAGTGDDAVTASGHFTAQVSLTAKFNDEAAKQTLGGRISGFEAVEGQGTGHVNPNWRLDLADKAFTGSFDDGTFDRKSVDGKWTAAPYGSDDKARPDGVFGAFNADFSDGKASGVYHAD